MNIHNHIMNIQIDRARMMDQLNFVSDYNTAYKLGYRDARHAAAELSLEAEARIEELEDFLKKLWYEIALTVRNTLLIKY